MMVEGGISMCEVRWNQSEKIGRVAAWLQRWNCLLPVLLVVLVSLLGGCAGTRATIVEVPVKPKLVLPGNIGEFRIQDFGGPADCARDLWTGIHELAVRGKLTPVDPRFRSVEEPLHITGTIEDCSLRMGYGALKATITLSLGEKPLHQELVRQETTRPGASREEVRGILVDRAVKQVASIFVSDWKSELREVCAQGSSDPVWIALHDKNWKHARELVSELTRKDSQDHCAWFNSGITHEGLKQFDEAVRSYQKAVDVDQNEKYSQALSRAKRSLDSFRAINAERRPGE
ncbi:hypothetical protein COMA2_40077 [Candidatus Nitrospira nitrificans]|uniref:Uncharacterized protein n=1 Tax=Candidatus Nitrospira nitrificans TaxID=1742973 RepID=A0A0S4LMQ1_9BACT|nr:hypothetical protein COMA2_40077 [Candidatus Nitrospira nitrificans]